MPTPKTVIVAQALISCMMAFLMTGIFSLMALGPTAEFLKSWLQHFITAWPIAFCLSIIVSKVAFAIAIKLTTKKSLA